MKKTFFLLVAVVGTAMSLEASPVILDAKDYHYVPGMGTSGHGSPSEMTNIMQALLEHVHRDEEIFRDSLSGWFIGSENNDEDLVRGNTTAYGNSVMIKPHYNDEVIILGLALPEEAELFELKFSFDTRLDKDNDKIGWTVWDYHFDPIDPYGKVGKVHIHSAENSESQDASGSITIKFDGEGGDLLTGDYVFIMWNTQASEDYLKINGIEASYTKAGGEVVPYHYTVPEPAAATLSLLALAGLAARRRRK